MTTGAKITLADAALALRDEHLEAEDREQRESSAGRPPLDSVSERIAAEIRTITDNTGAHTVAPEAALDRGEVEIALIQSLREVMSRLFRAGKLSSVTQRKITEVSKRFARLFFESELHEKIRGSKTELKKMHLPEQAAFYALSRHEETLLLELGKFEYTTPDVLAAARDRIGALIKESRTSYLGCTTPELNDLVRQLNEVLARYFANELPPDIGELSWEVVREGRLADEKAATGYKVSSAAFPRFRQIFERRFLRRLVSYVEDEMLRRVRAQEGKFRVDTIRFVADPQIFSDICEVICDTIYEYLYTDGFIDLPRDWREKLLRS